MVSEVNRAGRDAFELLYYLFELRRFGAIIQTPKEELDLTKLVDLINLAFKTAAAEEQVLLRGAGSKRTKTRNFLKGEWNLPKPLGYKGKEPWIKKDPTWESVTVFRDIFTLFLEMKNYGSVCRTINRLHKDFLLLNLKRLLTSEEIKRILTNPVYMGKPQSSGAVKEDLSLAYVGEEIFQKVQPIIEEISERYTRQEKPYDEIARIFGADAQTILPHLLVPCPRCRKPMSSDGSQGYTCTECNTFRTDFKKSEIAALRDYLLYREKRLLFVAKWSKKHNWTGRGDKEFRKLESLLKNLQEKENKKKRKRKKSNGGDKNE